AGSKRTIARSRIATSGAILVPSAPWPRGPRPGSDPPRPAGTSLPSRAARPELGVLAHEALARGAHERHRLGKEHAHCVTKGDRLLVGATVDPDLSERGGGQLDSRVQRRRRELLPLRLL